MPVPLAARLVVASVALATAAGCSSSPKPSVASTPSPTPTPTTAAAPSAPALPAAAQGTSRRAAVAFVKHWIATLNYAGETLDTRPLKALSSPDCGGCLGAAGVIDDVRRNGGKIEGHHWEILESRLLDGATRKLQVQAVVRMAPSRVWIDRSGPPKKSTGATTVYVFDLRTVRDRLQVTRVFGSST